MVWGGDWVHHSSCEHDWQVSHRPECVAWPWQTLHLIGRQIRGTVPAAAIVAPSATRRHLAVPVVVSLARSTAVEGLHTPAVEEGHTAVEEGHTAVEEGHTAVEE